MLAFGHMLPHSVGVLESIGKDRNIAFKFTLVGYLLVFFIEKIAFNSHALLHDAMEDKSGEHSGHSHSQNKIDLPQVANEIALNAQSAIAHTTNYLAASSAVETSPLSSTFTVSSSSATIIESGDNEVFSFLFLKMLLMGHLYFIFSISSSLFHLLYFIFSISSSLFHLLYFIFISINLAGNTHVHLLA